MYVIFVCAESTIPSPFRLEARFDFFAFQKIYLSLETSRSSFFEKEEKEIAI